ncbi:thioredoxin fold domain-containing protein [Candidatus Venteria ishoeyi]|uniref:thioredoxin family protein n=1 Tax=Candidatus Venteria ishoeyi TaxID=1899563 RepID=UPI0025A53EF8|nr:thioredoxin fold domain-containing protein [Candidatus Venteria ishoeyi]MDM8546384.1 thioredoxin fold domain-containing protein [Candidatus Venteria ishoeyi]
MQHYIRFYLLLSLLLCSPLALAEKAPLQGGVHFELPDWFKSSFLELPEDVVESQASGKMLMLMFHQDSCPYCAKLIQDNLGQDNIRTYLQQHFEVIGINLWGDRELTDLDGTVLTEKTFSQKHRVWATPTLFFLDKQGQLVFRINGYYPPEKFLSALSYVADKQYTKQSFLNYFRHQKSTMQAEATIPEASVSKDFFASPPYHLAQDGGDKPLAVLFETPDCLECQNLYPQVFNQAATRKQLAAYYVVRLDPHSDTPLITPDGKRSSARQWAQSLQINYLPSLVLFDQQQEVLRIAAMFKAFHVQSLLDYVSSGAYQRETNIQRYLHNRADGLREKGITVNLWD